MQVRVETFSNVNVDFKRIHINLDVLMHTLDIQ